MKHLKKRVVLGGFPKLTTFGNDTREFLEQFGSVDECENTYRVNFDPSHPVYVRFCELGAEYFCPPKTRIFTVLNDSKRIKTSKFSRTMYLTSSSYPDEAGYEDWEEDIDEGGVYYVSLK